eukprot:TRINITY_DN10492_c0_g2_i1.p1 TRINITY_DN10492_c0_g2~~TRINITY_DN10492_c0_g2_i1.p1  ORF type:complete len:176 (+),score=28.97 TRINITY_DN10492_c0_g2_i1:66-593(+)
MEEKKELSDRVKGMKFMKRKEETKLRERLEEERRKEIEAAQWTVPTSGGLGKSLVIIDDSPVASSSFKIGRRSFGNFNPNIEKITGEAKSAVKNAQLTQQAEEDSVSEEDMALRYSEYIGLRGNTHSKRSHTPKESDHPVSGNNPKKSRPNPKSSSKTAPVSITPIPGFKKPKDF